MAQRVVTVAVSLEKDAWDHRMMWNDNPVYLEKGAMENRKKVLATDHGNFSKLPFNRNVSVSLIFST